MPACGMVMAGAMVMEKKPPAVVTEAEAVPEAIRVVTAPRALAAYRSQSTGVVTPPALAAMVTLTML